MGSSAQGAHGFGHDLGGPLSRGAWCPRGSAPSSSRPGGTCPGTIWTGSPCAPRNWPPGPVTRAVLAAEIAPHQGGRTPRVTVVEVVADEGIRSTSLERMSALAAGPLFEAEAMSRPIPPDRVVGDRRQLVAVNRRCGGSAA